MKMKIMSNLNILKERLWVAKVKIPVQFRISIFNESKKSKIRPKSVLDNFGQFSKILYNFGQFSEILYNFGQFSEIFWHFLIFNREFPVQTTSLPWNQENSKEYTVRNGFHVWFLFCKNPFFIWYSFRISSSLKIKRNGWIKINKR